MGDRSERLSRLKPELAPHDLFDPVNTAGRPDLEVGGYLGRSCNVHATRLRNFDEHEPWPLRAGNRRGGGPVAVEAEAKTVDLSCPVQCGLLMRHWAEVT